MPAAEAVWQVASWLPSQWMMRSALRAVVGDMNAEQASTSIQMHYDLTGREGGEIEEEGFGSEEGRTIYEAFLDPTMTYTAAIFSGAKGETLEQAQRRKVDRIWVNITSTSLIDTSHCTLLILIVNCDLQ